MMGDLVYWLAIIAVILAALNLVATFSSTTIRATITDKKMDETPSNERLKELVTSICEEQDKLMRVKGMSREMNASIAAKLEPLKTPIYVLRQILGYADFPQSRMQAYWLASFKTSPTDFLSECIVQIKNGDIPVDDLNLRCYLIDFYSEMITASE